MSLVLDPGPGAGPGLVPDWLQDRSLRILCLRYTGLEGLIAASDYLSLDGPRIGYGRLVLLAYSSNQSQGMDILSVITLGHTCKQPLMCL